MRFFNLLLDKLDKEDRVLGNKAESIEEKIKRLKKLPRKLKQKSKDDEQFDAEYKSTALFASIDQLEQAILEISTLPEGHQKNLEQLKWEFSKLSRAFRNKLLSMEIPQSNVKPSSEDSKNWFKVGILFATGEIDLNEKSANFTALAKKYFGDDYEGYRPYISESMNNSTLRSQNIFRSLKKWNALYSYCLTNKIEVVSEFIIRQPNSEN